MYSVLYMYGYLVYVCTVHINTLLDEDVYEYGVLIESVSYM